MPAMSDHLSLDKRKLTSSFVSLLTISGRFFINKRGSNPRLVSLRKVLKTFSNSQWLLSYRSQKLAFQDDLPQAAQNEKRS